MALIDFLLLIIILSGPVASTIVLQHTKNFIPDILKQTFPSTSFTHLIYFCDQNNIISPYLEEQLLMIDVQFFVYSLKHVEIFKMDIPEGDGYIISSENVTAVEKFLSKDNKNFHFPPHKPILAFFHNSVGLYSTFHLPAAIDGLHLITVTGLKSYFHQYLWKMDIAVETVVVTSHQRDESLAYWKYSNDTAMKEKHFWMSSWKPNFAIETNRKFRVGYVHFFPLVMHDENNNELWGGIEYNIIKEVTKDWPVEWFYNKMDTQKNNIFLEFINKTMDGDWDTNMGGQLQKDILLSGAVATVPYTQLCITFLAPKPRLLPVLTFVFQPFQLRLWLLIIAMILILTAFLTISVNQKQYYRTTEQQQSDKILQFLYIFRIATSGSSPWSDHVTNRFILTAWCVTALILATAYSAGFTTSLALPRYHKPINTAEDLANSNLQWLHSNNYFQLFFKSLATPESQILANNFKRVQCHMLRNALLKTNNYATIARILPEGGIVEADTFDEFGRTHLKILQTCFTVNHVALTFAKHSPFKKIFNEKIFKFIEHGFIIFWYNQIVQRADYAYIENFYNTYIRRYEHIPLRLFQLQGAFILLLFGNIISLIVFVTEMFIFLHKIRK